MALTANAITETKHAPLSDKYGCASGALHIYQGALLNFNTSGYVKLGADAASEKFAGVAQDELNQATGGSNGDNKILILAKGSGVCVKLKTTGAVTVVNIGDNVYADGDDAVDLVGGVANSVLVGVIRNIIDANTAWVQI